MFEKLLHFHPTLAECVTMLPPVSYGNYFADQLKIRQSTIYIIQWFAGRLGRWDKRLTDQASDVPSIFYHYFL